MKNEGEEVSPGAKRSQAPSRMPRNLFESLRWGGMSRFARVLLVPISLLLPACGGGGGASPPIVLLSEPFNSFPNSEWSTPATTGGGSMTVDLAEGNPAPALVMTSISGAGTASTTNTATFAAPPLTVSFDMKVSLSTAINTGGIMISITDSIHSASAQVVLNDSGEAGFTITISGDGPSISVPITAGVFHHVTLVIDRSGVATLSLDSVPEVVSTSVGGLLWPAGQVTVAMQSSILGAAPIPTLWLDNLTITSP